MSIKLHHVYFIHCQIPNMFYITTVVYFIGVLYLDTMTFSSPLPFIFLYLPPRVHLQLHLSTTTKQVWACGPQETWPCSDTLLVISFAFEFRRGPDSCALSSVWTIAGVEFGWPCG